MDTGYKSNVKINFTNGDVKIEVSNGKETFSFISGIGSIALPHFFDTLTKFYKGDIKKEKFYCHGNGEFYNYITDGINLTIEHIDDYYGQYDIARYHFNFRKYMEAVEIGFTDYLNKFEQKGKSIPLKERDQFHPLNEEVLNYFYKFSALTNG